MALHTLVHAAVAAAPQAGPDLDALQALQPHAHQHVVLVAQRVVRLLPIALPGRARRRQRQPDGQERGDVMP